jgi:LPXTG-site transpeptidase (sortase) family protein
MPVNRWAPAASVLAVCLGVVLIAGLRPAPPPAIPPPAVSAVATVPSPIPTASASATPSAIAAGHRINIPRLAIDLPILEGDVERDAIRQETPDNFAFHLPGSGIPGAGGNAYIYAHARHGMFLALWGAREGDEVWIVTPDARELRYVVSEVHRTVDPADLSWIAPTISERLTLQTSTGPRPDDPRFVVIALPG